MTPIEALGIVATNAEEPILTADGFDGALIGYAEVFCGHTSRNRAVYDRQASIDILVKRDGMTPDEADEFFEFNVQGALIDGAPIFLRKL